MDFMRDDLAAVDIKHHVPVKIQAPHTRGQPRNIPGPQPVRFGRAMTGDSPGAGLFCPAAVMLLFFVFQYPVDGRFRCQILAPISQRRHDLAWRTTGKLGAVGNLQNLPALVFAQLVCRRYAPAALRPSLGLPSPSRIQRW